MKPQASDVLLTAVAPVVWGSTYIVTTQFLPNFSPIAVAMLRALPAGLLLLLIVRQLPSGIWWLRTFVLGALNISVFLSMLFVAAYRLPGGVAGTVAAVQPLFAVFLARLLLGSALRVSSVVAALVGIGGVALLVLSPRAALDPISTLKIEDLMRELEDEYTIVIVTHNMQQAARISDTTMMMTLDPNDRAGYMVEVGDTQQIFTNPRQPQTEAYVTGRYG